jgi:hypothetical protein
MIASRASGPAARRNCDRCLIRIEITQGARDALDDFVERRGGKRIVTVSRLIEWFVTREELVQAIVMGQMHAPPGLEAIEPERTA